MRSSVNGTRGSIDIIDLVRKSSGVIIGGLRDESDLAADRKAFKEAVRFDLNADLCLIGSNSVGRSFTLSSDGLWNTRKSKSSMSMSANDNGSSATDSPGDGKG
jgi:hypothetical protein